MKLSTKIAYNAIVQIISKTAATAMGLFALGIMARQLGTDGFGGYTTIITFLTFFGVMADMGMTLVTVQMISRPGWEEKKVLNNLFSLRLFSALLIIGLSPLAVYFFPYSGEIKLGVALGAGSFIFIALNQVLVGLFQTRLRMDKVSIAEVISRAFLLMGVMLSASLNWGLYGFIAASVAASGANFLLLYRFAKKFAVLKLDFDFGLWKKIFHLAWPLATTIILNLIYLRTDILFLSLWKSQADVGIYGAAYKVIDVVVTIPFIFSGIILPVITVHWHAGETAKFHSIMQKSFDFLAVIAIPMMTGSVMLAGPIMSLIAGQEFAPSGAPLTILIFGAGAIFLGNTAAHAIIAIDKQKKIIPAYIFTALTSIIGYAIFIPRYSYVGAAAITVYSEAMIALASIWLIWRYVGFIPKLEIAFKSLAASLAMSAVIYLASGRPLILVIALAVAAYAFFSYLFKAVSKKDIDDLISLN